MRIATDRLIVRDWRDEDIPLYAAISGDPVVRRYFVEVSTYADVELAISRYRDRLSAYGYTMNALERKFDGALLGTVGLAPLKDNMRGMLRGNPPAEIGWQLGQQFWGQGYAPEAARAVLAFGWQLGLPEIVAITYEGNQPSRRVMEKLGMTRDPADDFMHPDVPDGHRLRPHVLYRVGNPIA